MVNFFFIIAFRLVYFLYKLFQIVKYCPESSFVHWKTHRGSVGCLFFYIDMCVGLLAVDEVEEGLLVAVANGDVLVAKDYAVAVNLLDFAFLDNE